MESKINYALVGVFVLALFAGLFSFVYWLGKYGGQDDYKYYYVYMTESVAGLSTDASVKYHGVNVGTVEKIALSSINTEQVELLLKLQQNTPIKVNTTATLKSFGLTGLSYIELSGGSHQTPLLSKPDEIATIPSRPSTFTRIDESLSSLTLKITSALDNFNLLLSSKNLNNVSSTLTEIKILAKEMRQQQESFQSLVDNGIIMEKRITNAFKKIELASNSVKNMANTLEINSTLVGYSMSQGIDQSKESFNQLLSELNILARHLQKTTQGFQASPSDFIFKSSQPKPGPGEEGYHEK